VSRPTEFVISFNRDSLLLPDDAGINLKAYHSARIIQKEKINNYFTHFTCNCMFEQFRISEITGPNINSSCIKNSRKKNRIIMIKKKNKKNRRTKMNITPGWFPIGKQMLYINVSVNTVV
jgi:hypothetical protein